MNFSVKVNGELILAKSINSKYNYYIRSLQKTEDFLSQNEIELSDIKIEIANKMIDKLLLIQYGIEKKLIPSDEEVNRELNKTKGCLTKEKKNDKTKKSITAKIILNNISEYILLNTIPKEDDWLKLCYNENKKYFSLGDAVEVRHILIKCKDDSSKDEAFAKAKNILDRLENGEDFAELAKSFSDCQSGIRGGDLGFITHNSVDKTFEECAFKLNINEVSEIVETEHGFHIIEVFNKTKNYVLPFESVKEKFEKFIKKRIKKEAIENLLCELRNKADIEFIGIK